MTDAAEHPREAARLAALREYDVLDTPREAEFDDIARLASEICGAPISLVCLIDADRQWFKAETGFGRRETPLESSICAHAILVNDVVEIEDTAADPRMRGNPLVDGEPRLRFYASAPLRTPEGLPLGTLCVLDYAPRALSPLQRNALRVLARQVMAQLDLRLALKRQELLRLEIDHRVKNSLASVAAVIRLQLRETADPAVVAALKDAETRIGRIALLHDHLYRASSAQEVDFAAYLGQVGAMLEGAAPDGVTIVIEAAPIVGDARTAAQIGVIVTEFVLNSAKHAFPGGRAGWIRIALRQTGEGVELHCQDNGVGRADGAAASGGIGLRLMKASAQQAGGEMRLVEGVEGFGVVVRLAVRPARATEPRREIAGA